MNDDEIVEDTAIVAEDTPDRDYATAEAACCGNGKAGYAQTEPYDENRYLREQLVAMLIPQMADSPLTLIGTASLLEAYIRGRI